MRRSEVSACEDSRLLLILQTSLHGRSNSASAVASGCLETLPSQECPKLGGIFRITVNNEMAFPMEHIGMDVKEISCRLKHPRVIRIGCDPTSGHLASRKINDE